MKNLKKLVSVIVTVAMLISSLAVVGVSAADYADVEATNSYYKAIKVLSGLGIVKGDDEGNFNPTDNIKRSEMVALICRMKGEDAIASSTMQQFDDVPSTHWAAGYINWGVGSEIIKGYGNGNFGPDDAVTLQDAVVMIIRAAGWERIANRSDYGGYPTGHMRIANARGVMNNINFAVANAATREVIAQAIYNGLTMPLVEYSSYGEKVEDDRYVVNENATLLTNTNKIFKVQAEVKETAKENPAFRADVDNQQVKLDVVDTYNYNLSAVAPTLDGGEVTVFVGATDVADYLGYTVEAYITYDNDLRDYKLLAVAVDEAKVVTKELTTANEIFANYDAANDKFFYYATATASRTSELDLADSLTVYYNGRELTNVTATGAADLNDLFVNFADKLVFMGEKNKDFDTIFVTDYEYRQVVEVNEEALYIETDGIPVLLDKEDRNDDTFVYYLYDAEGNEIALSDIAEDDILNIVAPLTSAGTKNADAIDYLEIYVTSNAVTGSVDEDNGNGTYVIAGDVYAPAAGVTLAVGDEGIFFVTIDGQVYDKDTTSAISKNFALLLGSEIESKFNQDSIEIQVFTAEGKIETFKVASTIKVNGVRKLISDGTAKAYFNSAAFTGLYADGVTDVAGRIFTYKLNSNGELAEISFAGTGYTKTTANVKFNKNTSIFNGTFVTANTVLFEAPLTTTGAVNVDVDKLKISSFKAMDEDTAYNVAYFVFDNETTEIAAAVYAGEITSGTKFAKLAVVKSVSSVYSAEDNTNVVKYTYVQSGEVKEATVDPDKALATMGVGDVFRYTVNADGEINSLVNIYDLSADAFTPGTLTETNAAANKEWILEGTIAKVERNDNGRLVTIGGTKYLLNDDEANTYVSVNVATATGAVNASAGVEVMANAAGLRASYSAQTYDVIALVNEDGLIDDAIMFVR